MQESEVRTWLARDSDGRVLEVDASGYPGSEASPDDGRPVAEAVNDVKTTADYCGGQGRKFEADAEAHYAAHREEFDREPGQYDAPWWDGERMASDREPSPGLVAELEAGG